MRAGMAAIVGWCPRDHVRQESGMRKLWVLLAIFLSCGAFGQDRQAAAPSCERLEQIGMSGVEITSARTIAAGALPAPPSNAPPGMGVPPSFYQSLPAFCKRTA